MQDLLGILLWNRHQQLIHLDFSGRSELPVAIWYPTTSPVVQHAYNITELQEHVDATFPGATTLCSEDIASATEYEERLQNITTKFLDIQWGTADQKSMEIRNKDHLQWCVRHKA